MTSSIIQTVLTYWFVWMILVWFTISVHMYLRHIEHFIFGGAKLTFFGYFIFGPGKVIVHSYFSILSRLIKTLEKLGRK